MAETYDNIMRYAQIGIHVQVSFFRQKIKKMISLP